MHRPRTSFITLPQKEIRTSSTVSEGNGKTREGRKGRKRSSFGRHRRPNPVRRTYCVTSIVA